MSIFPKRTLRDTTVTIHWNFQAAGLAHTHLFPYARLGVQAPDGQLTMLYEGHLLRLPEGDTPSLPPEVAATHYLPKNVPLLVLASYLSGRQPRATLVNMLRGMQTGRHYYFTYAVPPNAPLGRYTLLSELYTDGQLQHSGTAVEDFFLVEHLKLAIALPSATEGRHTTVVNPGPEPVPVRIIEYDPSGQCAASYVRDVPAHGTLPITPAAPQCFVLYNEERQVLPVNLLLGPAFLRNQQLLSLEKVTEGQAITYVLTGEEDEAYELSGPSREVWQRADGLASRQQLDTSEQQAAYDELLAADLIQELPL